MSRRRYRDTNDKRTVAFELARFCGHGSELPDLDEPRDEADPAEFDITEPEQQSASAISPSA
jgi:hypothetical protein